MSAGPAGMQRILPPFVVLIAAAIAWETIVRLAHVSPLLLPGPLAVFGSLMANRDELLSALGWTTLAALTGFACSAVLGVGVATLLSTSALLRRAIYPYTLFFQTVPIIAIAPMLLIWLGVGLEPVTVCALIVSVFPVIANTLAGLLSIDPALQDMFRLYGARPVAALWKLRLPSALPGIFTGLRIAAGLAVIGTVVRELTVGEIVGRVGLGVLVVTAVKVSRTDLAFAAVLLASLLGLAMFGAVNIAARLALRHWHPSER